MRHQSFVLLEHTDQFHCVHIEGSQSAGRVAAFLNETKTRFELECKSLETASESDNSLSYESVRDFYKVFTHVVNEYYDHYSTDEQGHATIMRYKGDDQVTGLGKNYFGVQNDFSCEAIDRVIFTDKELTHYENLTAFFASQPKTWAW